MLRKLLFAKELRDRQTETEKLLWFHLRSHKLNGLKFKRQQIIGPFIVDFVCFEYKLIVEADGGQHNTDEVIAKDKKRTMFLEKNGYTVLRFWDNEVFNHLDLVLEKILLHASPSP